MGRSIELGGRVQTVEQVVWSVAFQKLAIAVVFYLFFKGNSCTGHVYIWLLYSNNPSYMYIAKSRLLLLIAIVNSHFLPVDGTVSMNT